MFKTAKIIIKDKKKQTKKTKQTNKKQNINQRNKQTKIQHFLFKS
jgi:hypothetical protein